MFVEVPKLDEFSAFDAWQQVKDKPEYSCYFKEYSSKAVPGRAYLYNVSLPLMNMALNAGYIVTS